LASGRKGRSDSTFPSPETAAPPIPVHRGVTIVIPAFHAKATIQRAVESVAEQPGVEPEIIVVIDDGCTETRERVERLGLACCRVLMNPSNLGAQASRNRGLAEASSSFVMFLDSDDFLTGELLLGLLDAARDADADLSLGPWRILTGAGKLLPIQIPQPAAAEAVFWRWLANGTWVSPSAVLWRTEFVRSIGGWDVRIRRHQDAEITLRGIARGARLAFSSKGAGVYERHDSEHRITRSLSNYDSLFDVAEALLEADGAIPRQKRQAAVARYLYRIAVRAFRRGDDEFGNRALARSRQLGFRGHRGRVARLGSLFLGTRRYNKLAPRLRESLLRRR
jgi:glycosyltransferase involved in cell wall biosynthesis